MKRIIILLIISVALIACNDTTIYTPIEIRIIKEATSDIAGEKTFYASVGVEGNVDYESFEHKDNPDLKYVNVHLTNKTNEHYKHATIQYLVNIKTGLYQINAIEIDGKPKSILEGLLDLTMMAVESTFPSIN